MGKGKGRHPVASPVLFARRIHALAKGPHCAICTVNEGYVGFGSCGHDVVCYRCTLRLRVIQKDRCCPICKAELDKVVLSNDPKALELEEATEPDLHGIVYGDDAVRERCELLLAYKDWHSRQGRVFSTLQELEWEVERRHRRAFCHPCLYGRSAFLCEQLLFDKGDLKRHCRAGEEGEFHLDPHPLCEFCDKRFFAAEELKDHMRRKHATCPMCPRNEFYKDYFSLYVHFEEKHYPCTHADCVKLTVVGMQVFPDPESLQVHILDTHTDRTALTQKERKQVMRINIPMGQASYRSSAESQRRTSAELAEAEAMVVRFIQVYSDPPPHMEEYLRIPVEDDPVEERYVRMDVRSSWCRQSGQSDDGQGPGGAKDWQKSDWKSGWNGWNGGGRGGWKSNWGGWNSWNADDSGGWGERDKKEAEESQREEAEEEPAQSDSDSDSSSSSSSAVPPKELPARLRDLEDPGADLKFIPALHACLEAMESWSRHHRHQHELRQLIRTHDMVDLSALKHLRADLVSVDRTTEFEFESFVNLRPTFFRTVCGGKTRQWHTFKEAVFSVMEGLSPVTKQFVRLYIDLCMERAATAPGGMEMEKEFPSLAGPPPGAPADGAVVSTAAADEPRDPIWAATRGKNLIVGTKKELRGSRRDFPALSAPAGSAFPALGGGASAPSAAASAQQWGAKKAAAEKARVSPVRKGPEPPKKVKAPKLDAEMEFPSLPGAEKSGAAQQEEEDRKMAEALQAAENATAVPGAEEAPGKKKKGRQKKVLMAFG